MTDDINKKVIDLFSANKGKKPIVCKDNQVCQTTEGFSYVTIRKDDQGRYFDEEHLIERANEFYYIVKVLVREGRHPSINNYNVPGDKLLDFIKIYIDGKGEGQIIEIDKFYPEEWA